jgi:hypothetical protein
LNAEKDKYLLLKLKLMASEINSELKNKTETQLLNHQYKLHSTPKQAIQRVKEAKIIYRIHSLGGRAGEPQQFSRVVLQEPFRNLVTETKYFFN